MHSDGVTSRGRDTVLARGKGTSKSDSCEEGIEQEQIGQPRWCSGLAPPAAWGVILETWDRVPHRAPCMEPASPSPSACVSASLSVSMNK